jgi:gliding motility-associated-like protein
MKKIFRSFVCLFLITAFSSLNISAQNLIVNGDFTAGNTGFTTSYLNVPNPNPFGVKGAYDIVTNPKVWFTPFDACPDHTTGSGRMMVVDGSDTNAGNNKLWEQTVTVVPGKTYQFSYFLQSVTVGFPARIEILINGVSLGSSNTAPATTCNWAQRNYSWNSGISSSAIITIYDREISGGGNDFAIDDLSFTACPNAPIVTTPVYLCQNSPSFPLTATASVGSTLIWYGTNPVGGIGSPTAPTPSTTTVGATTYYVSQTDGICESSRSAIVVNVVADNGATILGLRCDPSQIPPADINTSVFFDWSNNVLINDNSYNYSYTIQGGPPVTGTRIVSNLPLIGLLLPGQSATITLTATRFPCAPPQTMTCTVPCVTTTTPNFAPIAPFCTGTPAPILGTTSPNGISGTWNPTIINNTTSGSYTFTPDPLLFPCALTQTLGVTVDPLVTPAFTTIPVFVCQGSPALTLPLSSNNVTPITGTWSPAIVNTAVLGTFPYIFTPNPGQCTSATPTTVSIRIDPVVTPTFAAVPAICSGATLVPLPTTSLNSITGTWSPALNNAATTTYTFTPTAGQCANTASLVITVNPILTPNFTAVPAICSGATLSALPTTSSNLITGTWSPALNNTATTIYTFTPTAGQCATTATMTITVNPNVTPLFNPVPAVCSGAIMTPLPTTSTNGITGTWAPALNNLATTTYTFTPTAGLCATFTTLTISVNPIVAPNFAPIPNVCSGSTAPILATTSPSGIVGTWSPAIISNTTNGSYTFTPASGQCSTTQTLNVAITPRVVTNFAAIPAFCSGTVAPILATTSPNGVNGTWSPATINNTTSGSYIFTPNATECAISQTLSVIVNPNITPDFEDLSICSGTVAPVLPAISPNGITGTWLPSTINNTTSGAYVFTPNAPQCATSKTINVTVNPSNTLVSISWIVTDAFTKNQIVTVTATAAGNYLYQLDSGPFQTSTVFENMASGLHSITVIDANGCSAPITDNNVLVIGYPKFFTPNGDGYNDIWNITSLSDQLNTRIYIFDRYGKLLKDISPNGSGWDGTYIGQPMPADDYWFTVEYSEQNIIKKYKSHFSLKR